MNDIWSKGFVVIAELNLSTASYVARYTLKKQGLKKYDDLNIQAPFILMSTRPGIGYDYLISHKNSLSIQMNILIEHKYYPLPRYFKRVLEDDFGFNMSDFKEAQQNKIYNHNLVREIYSKNDLKQILEAEELNLEAQQTSRRKL